MFCRCITLRAILGIHCRLEQQKHETGGDTFCTCPEPSTSKGGDIALAPNPGVWHERRADVAAMAHHSCGMVRARRLVLHTHANLQSRSPAQRLALAPANHNSLFGPTRWISDRRPPRRLPGNVPPVFEVFQDMHVLKLRAFICDDSTATSVLLHRGSCA